MSLINALPPVIARKNVAPPVEREARAPVSPAPPINQNSPNVSPLAATPSAAPLMPPAQEVPQLAVAAADDSSANTVQRQVADKNGAIQVQQRLIELGYLSGPATGRWGPQSKRALVQFKEQAGLEKTNLGMLILNAHYSVAALCMPTAHYCSSVAGASNRVSVVRQGSLRLSGLQPTERRRMVVSASSIRFGRTATRPGALMPSAPAAEVHMWRIFVWQ